MNDPVHVGELWHSTVGEQSRATGASVTRCSEHSTFWPMNFIPGPLTTMEAVCIHCSGKTGRAGVVGDALRRCEQYATTGRVVVEARGTKRRRGSPEKQAGGSSA